jgi:hypothetical protein
MGVYSIIFQFNVIVIAAIEWITYGTHLSLPVVFGGILVFASGLAVLISNYINVDKLHQGFRFDRKFVIAGVVSAVTCGVALYIDGEVGKNYIFAKGINPLFFAAFFMYEALTFGIPALISIIIRLARQGPNNTIKDLHNEFRRGSNEFNYFRSSLFSSMQFVFSVFALSVSDVRFIVAMVLGLSPVLSVFLDKNKRPVIQIRLEYLLAIVALIGLILILSRTSF